MSTPSVPNDERTLLLLGLLYGQNRHGYELNEFIENNLRCTVQLKKATAYALLDKLETVGWIASITEQKGHRPPRKVFSLSESGKVQFHLLLKQLLAHSDTLTLPSDVALMFIEHLPTAQAVSALQERLVQLDQQIQMYRHLPAHGGLGVSMALERARALLEADRIWLTDLISRLEA